jgi:hypothetical protein
MSKPIAMPTQEYLKICFEYDKGAGCLKWKGRPVSHFSNIKAAHRLNSRDTGKTINGIAVNGYLRVRLDGKLYYVHRII